jgi:hypothetical protein
MTGNNCMISPVTHRRGRLIDTYSRRLLVLQVSNDEAQIIQMLMRTREPLGAFPSGALITPISRSCSSRSPDWLKMKNPNAPAVKREAKEDWGKQEWLS